MKNGERSQDLRIGDVFPFARMIFTGESTDYAGVLIAREGIVEMVLRQLARVAVDIVDSFWNIEGDMVGLDANNGS